MDIAWVAGFFDAEGSCTTYKRNSYRVARLQIGQKDPELLYQTRDILGLGRVAGPIDSRSVTPQGTVYNHTFYQYRIDKQQDINWAIGQMWPYLGSLKRQQFLANTNGLELQQRSSKTPRSSWFSRSDFKFSRYLLDASTITNWSWAAGFFDGEGCTTVQNARMRFLINQSHPESLERIKGVIGAGNLLGPYSREYKSRYGEPRIVYHWRYQLMTQSQIDTALGKLWPSLGESKKRQALDWATKCQYPFTFTDLTGNIEEKVGALGN